MNHKSFKPYYILLLGLLLSSYKTLQAQAFSGHAKLFPVYLKTSAQTSADSFFVINSRTQFDLFEDSYHFSAAYEIDGVHVSNPELSLQQNTSAKSYRVQDLNTNLVANSDESMRIQQNLDRLFVSYDHSDFNLSLGRQAIAFGVGRLVNPSDVFMPLSLLQLDKEYRQGVDALRLRLPLSELNTLELGHLFGEGAKFHESADYVRLSLNQNYIDTEWILTRFKEATMMACNISFSLGTAGLWIEGAHVKAPQEHSYSSYVIGTSYVFSYDIFSSVEYHKNQAGAKDPAKYADLEQSFAYQTAGVYLKGQDYLSWSFQRNFYGLYEASLQVIDNLNESSQFISSSVSYNLSQDQYLALNVFAPVGTGPAEGEFRNYPLISYLSWRYYF